MPAVMIIMIIPGTRRMRMTTEHMTVRMNMAMSSITVTIITMTTMVGTGITTAIPMLMTTNKAAPPAPPVAMTERETAALYRLMTWLSPAFPVGSFSYSSGIEWAVEAGDIADSATLADWLDAMLGDGSGFCDATFLVHAYRAAEAGEESRLREVAELAAAFVP